MFLKKNVEDIMIPIEKYSVISIGESLKEAILDLRKIYCEVETGKCTEAGHRTSLVVNEYGHVTGMIDFTIILNTLIPHISEKFTEKLPTHVKTDFKQRVLKNAEVKVSDIMLQFSDSLQSDDNLLVALQEMHRNKVTVLPVYKGGKLVGVLRDSDLFLAAASILTD
jgi:CBS domain containing-hemolysin-like protein